MSTSSGPGHYEIRVEGVLDSRWAAWFGGLQVEARARRRSSPACSPMAGSAVLVGGLYWLSRLSERSSYDGGLLGPMLVLGVGFGLLFVTLNLVGLARVRDEESGVASSLLNTGQQVGGSIGLAVSGTVACTVVANSVRANNAHARVGHPARPSQAALTSIYQHALAAGFSRAFLAAAGAILLALIITTIAIRVRRADLAGASHPEPRAAGPGIRCSPMRKEP